MNNYELNRAFARLKAEYHALARRQAENAAALEKNQRELREAWGMLSRLQMLDAAMRAKPDGDEARPMQ